MHRELQNSTEARETAVDVANRKIMVRLLLTEAERKAWQTAADAAKLTLSEWIRRRCQGAVTIEPPPPAGVVMTGKRVPRLHPAPRKTRGSSGPREPR